MAKNFLQYLNVLYIAKNTKEKEKNILKPEKKKRITAIVSTAPVETRGNRIISLKIENKNNYQPQDNEKIDHKWRESICQRKIPAKLHFIQKTFGSKTHPKYIENSLTVGIKEMKNLI